MSGVSTAEQRLVGTKNGAIAWITWETQRRNKELSAAFGAVFGHFDESRHRRLMRYMRSACKTIWLLRQVRPCVVVAQYPSIVLCVLCATLKPLFGYKLYLDAHNVFFDQLHQGNLLVRATLEFLLHRVDGVMVTNVFLEAELRERCVETLVLPDRMPDIHANSPPDFFHDLKPATPCGTLISSFDRDEPIAAFLDALSAIEQPFTLFVTGRIERVPELRRFESDKIHFTGFLESNSFDGLIQHSDFLVDLTTLPNCLVCGAYEALAVGRPILLSDSAALRDLFQEGVVFCENSAVGFQAGMREMLRSYPQLTERIRAFQGRFVNRWEDDFKKARAKLLESS